MVKALITCLDSHGISIAIYREYTQIEVTASLLSQLANRVTISFGLRNIELYHECGGLNVVDVLNWVDADSNFIVSAPRHIHEEQVEF